MNNKTTRNSFLLLVTAAVWGAAFVAQTVGGQTIGVYSFNCVRCIIGVLVLIPVMKFLDKKDLSPRKPKTKEDYKLLIKGGICCGVALCISTNLQQVGILVGASAGKAGFLTAVYILLVPILGLFLHKKCGIISGLQWICSIPSQVLRHGRRPFYHVRHGFRFCMQEFCPMVWDIRYRSLDKMGLILLWHP